MKNVNDGSGKGIRYQKNNLGKTSQRRQRIGIVFPKKVKKEYRLT